MPLLYVLSKKVSKMKFRFFIFIFFIFSCSPQLKTFKQNKPYSATGFAYVYNEHDFKNKIISGKLNNDKLQKNKDVNYNKETQQILSIPALHFNSDKHNFTLKIVDSKRVSTLKSLTPKRGDSNKKREKP